MVKFFFCIILFLQIYVKLYLFYILLYNLCIMFKKIFSFVLLAFIFLNIANVSAQNHTTSSSNWYNARILDNTLDFEAKLVNWKVEMNWSVYNQNDTLKYYKVVRSNKYNDPIYPDQWYIKYSSDINFTNYVDAKPLYWTVYYRVCAITKEMNRYCSNVVKLEIEKQAFVCTMEYVPVCWYKNGQYKTYSNKCMLEADGAYKKYYWKCKTEVETVAPVNNYWLTSRLKTKSRILINSFVSKLEKKWYSNTKNVEVIDAIIIKLNTLEDEKPKLSNLLNYLIELLKVKKEKYSDDFSDIEDIFNLD